MGRAAPRMQDEGGSQHGPQGLAESEERYRLISQIISDYTFSTRLNARNR